MKTLKMMALLCLSVLALVSCIQGNDTTATESSEPIAPPGIIIPVQEAENLYHRYGEKRVSLIEKAINVDDEGNPISQNDSSYVQATTSLTVDYTDLKNYLAFIEQEASNANTDITGLRIYFGKYADTTNDGRATMFMNPVKKYGAGGITDDVAFAIDKSGKKPKAVYVKDCYKVPGTMTNQANLTMPIQGTIQSLAANNSPWRPPPTNDPDYQ